MPVWLRMLVSDETIVMSTSSSGGRASASARTPIRTMATRATMKSTMIRRVRPWRSRSAPAMGATTRPGKMLANVTTPARAGESYSVRTKRTSATLTMDVATREICIESRIRPRRGIASRARYEASGVSGASSGWGITLACYRGWRPASWEASPRPAFAPVRSPGQSSVLSVRPAHRSSFGRSAGRGPARGTGSGASRSPGRQG